MLEIENLTKIYPVNNLAVNNVSFALDKSDVLGVFGPNGAGKSTILKILAGSLDYNQGSIKILSRDFIDHRIESLFEIGYVAEFCPLYKDMSCEEFLKFIAAIRQIKDKSAIDKVVEICELNDVFNKLISTLSNGFKTRVSLAQALIHDPAILILDEPTSGLDPNQKYHFRNLLLKIKQKKAIVISSHNLEEMKYYCNKCLIINHGQMIYNGPFDELFCRSIEHIDNYDFNQIFRSVIENTKNL